jgi:hypothetical protein
MAELVGLAFDVILDEEVVVLSGVVEDHMSATTSGAADVCGGVDEDEGEKEDKDKDNYEEEDEEEWGAQTYVQLDASLHGLSPGPNITE